MAAGYRVKTIKLESGERLPLLVSKETGLPLWDPTLFILTTLRATNLAANTLEQAARAVMVAHQIFSYLGIDLNDRMLKGQLLSLGEIEALVKLAAQRQEEMDSLLETQTTEKKTARVASFKKMTKRSVSKMPKAVNAETKTIRLIYIRNYIEWLVSGRRLKLDVNHKHYEALNEAARVVVGNINARMPERDYESSSRQGLSSEVRAQILEVTEPDSPENPWKNKHVRVRNRLIFLWLLFLGIRNGELLSIYAQDVNLRSGEVVVVRRPDNPEEVRKNAPLVKTRGRLLALGPELSELTRAYLIGLRSRIKGARRHPYLFVATGTGTPLSKSALNKLFRELRAKVPGLPDDLSPHVLRHTWNDDFSALMDERGVPPEEEEKMRRQAMGWSPNSKMAATYTKRHVQRKSNEASLAMQAKTFTSKKKTTS
jgi:integrase